MNLTEAWNRVRDGGVRVGGNERLRAEVLWVVSSRMSEYLLQFLLLKILATRLGSEAYGEMNLAETAALLLTHVLLAPARESFLRDYHRSIERGSQKGARNFILRWYAVSTTAVLVLSWPAARGLSESMEVESGTIVAAAFVFFFDRWRMLAADVVNIERRRRSWAIWNVAFNVALIGFISAATAIGPSTAATALFGYAAASGLFALIMMARWIRETSGVIDRSPTELGGLVRRFGVPFAVLLIFQWGQSFADRYLLKILLDPETVGIYVAAFRVCGIPFMFMLAIGHSLLTPIAYQRAGAADGRSGLWAADRVLLAGVAFHSIVGLFVVGGYAAFGSRLLVMMTTSEFQVSTATIVTLAGGRLLQTLSQLLQPIFAVHERIDGLLWLRLVGAGATVAICWPMIEAYGAFGAAFGTLLAFVIYLAGLVFGPSGCFWLIRDARRATLPPHA